jgi:NADH-quinone oxidoreductase subunit H
MKETAEPDAAYKPIFRLAPALAFIPALLTLSVIPLAAPLPTPWGLVPMVQVADLPIGFLYILAITSLGVYGITLAGWSSNNKYALLGGLRSSAQLVSYEIAMGLSTIPILLLAGNVAFGDIIAQQAAGGFNWNVVCSRSRSSPSWWPRSPRPTGSRSTCPRRRASCGRLPHRVQRDEVRDVLPRRVREHDHGERAHRHAVLRRLGRPVHDVGQRRAVVGVEDARDVRGVRAKTGFFLFFYIWVRWTLPRFRYDQLMSLGWKFMLPLALAYIVSSPRRRSASTRSASRAARCYGLALFGSTSVLLVLVFVLLDRGRLISPASARRARTRCGGLRARARARRRAARPRPRRSPDAAAGD